MLTDYCGGGLSLLTVTPLFKEFTGSDDDALQFVKRENLDRNHYNEAQRAMVGAKLKSLFEEQAKKRQIEAAKAGGSKTEDDYQRSSVTNTEKKVVPNLAPPSETGQSRDKAAEGR